jgi:hypothetical protein
MHLAVKVIQQLVWRKRGNPPRLAGSKDKYAHTLFTLSIALCYNNATYALYFPFLFISCLVTDHLTSHVTAGQVILTMTHRLKAFTLDAGLLLRMSLGDSWIAAQVLMTCVDSFLDCA